MNLDWFLNSRQEVAHLNFKCPLINVVAFRGLVIRFSLHINYPLITDENTPQIHVYLKLMNSSSLNFNL